MALSPSCSDFPFSPYAMVASWVQASLQHSLPLGLQGRSWTFSTKGQCCNFSLPPHLLQTTCMFPKSRSSAPPLQSRARSYSLLWSADPALSVGCLPQPHVFSLSHLEASGPLYIWVSVFSLWKTQPLIMGTHTINCKLFFFSYSPPSPPLSQL